MVGFLCILSSPNGRQCGFLLLIASPNEYLSLGFGFDSLIAMCTSDFEVLLGYLPYCVLQWLK